MAGPVERRFTAVIPVKGAVVEPPTGHDGWHVTFMTQGLTTGGPSASPLVVLLWEREAD